MALLKNRRYVYCTIAEKAEGRVHTYAYRRQETLREAGRLAQEGMTVSVRALPLTSWNEGSWDWPTFAVCSQLIWSSLWAKENSEEGRAAGTGDRPGHRTGDGGGDQRHFGAQKGGIEMREEVKAVIPARVGGYPVRPGGLSDAICQERLHTAYDLVAGDGKTVIGNIVFTSCWSTPGSWISSKMYQATARVDGVFYTGRTRGFGMVFHGKSVKGK